jgi:D-alanyl-D-alanine dipeptidase
MKGTRVLRAVVTAAVLSAVLSVGGFAQGGAATEQPGQRQSFRITPVRPIAELRAEALKAKPPEEQGTFVHPMLVEITESDKGTIRLEIRYATANNFLGGPVYEAARTFLQAPAASALRTVSAKLRKKGYGLLVYDAYRPWYVTKIFWDATPADKREFVADPATGSSHNRGCAIDLTLYDLRTGAAVAMPSEYDEMTPRAYADYADATAEEKKHRDILRKAMESEGFVQRPNEWWHFEYKNAQRYRLMNTPLDSISDVVYLVGTDVTPPKTVRRVDPEFTDDARKAHVEGTVILSLIVGEDGRPRDIQVERKLGHGLDEAAIQAIGKWVFEPGIRNGAAVPVAVSAEITFSRH